MVTHINSSKDLQTVIQRKKEVESICVGMGTQDTNHDVVHLVEPMPSFLRFYRQGIYATKKAVVTK